MNAPDSQVSTLLRESTTGLEPDVDLLVAGGIARGRTARRRRRFGTAVAAIAVVGIGGASVGIATSDDGSPEGVAVVDQPQEKAKEKAKEKENARTPKSEEPAPGAVDAALAVPAADVPDTMATMLPPGDMGPVLREHPFPVIDQKEMRVAHFRWNGALTTFVIDKASNMGTCRQQAREGGPAYRCETVGGLETLVMAPTEADLVTVQAVSVWQHGYIVSVLSYNAADGKDVAPLTDEPPISLEQLIEITSSDVWFS